jgi:sulfane dehydrogenase subunit SoxC
VRRVEVSADGGVTWADAELEDALLPRCLTRFRIPWRWDGGPTRLLSRARDESGAVQPTRDDWLARHATGQIYHCNAIQAWQVSADGGVRAAYA